MEFLFNTYDPDRPDADVNFCYSEDAFFDQRLAGEEWAAHIRGLQDKIISRPKATDHYTAEQLERMGMVGVYKTPPSTKMEVADEANATRASVKALHETQEMTSLLLALKGETKICTWEDVENCFPKNIQPLDEDFKDWIISIRSQARQIYLLEKAGDKSENEAARAAIQFINKKATAK